MNFAIVDLYFVLSVRYGVRRSESMLRVNKALGELSNAIDELAKKTVKAEKLLSYLFELTKKGTF